MLLSLRSKCSGATSRSKQLDNGIDIYFASPRGKMRILLDTNIIIPLEDSSQALEPHLARLNNLATTHKHQLVIHPGSTTDINRDRNHARAQITLSRLNRYPAIESPPRFRPEIPLSELDNDQVDDEILFALQRHAASVLVTEDRGIHKKSVSQGLGSQVLYIQQAVEWLERLHTERQVTFPNIEDVPLHTFDVRDPFFDSLRAGYKGFDAWFSRASQAGRKAWTYKSDSNTPLAICIYNREQDPIVTDEGVALRGSVLKLCTFKVGEDVRGRRIGELFLKAAFRYCFENGIQQTYLTMFDSHEHLRDLCVKYGFELFGRRSQGAEIVMRKQIPQDAPTSEIEPLEYHIKYSPCVKALNSSGIFIVPILPAYHGLLFPEIDRQLGLFDDSSVGNGLTLAYLCHANTKSISPGDILLFYRSRDRMQITTLGVVEKAFITNDQDEIARSVAKRTVFSLNDIQKMAGVKPVRVILFRLAFHFPNPIDRDLLTSKKISTGNIQSIRKISIDAFEKIADLAGFTRCVFTNKTSLHEDDSGGQKNG